TAARRRGISRGRRRRGEMKMLRSEAVASPIMALRRPLVVSMASSPFEPIPTAPLRHERYALFFVVSFLWCAILICGVSLHEALHNSDIVGRPKFTILITYMYL